MNKIDKYEKMQSYIIESFDECLQKNAELKAKDKTKSATHRQLIARKLKFEDMLSFYKMFDLM